MHAQSCLTLCNPIDCSPSGSSAHGIFPNKEYWSMLLFPTPVDLPIPVTEHTSLASPELVCRFFMNTHIQHKLIKCLLIKLPKMVLLGNSTNIWRRKIPILHRICQKIEMNEPFFSELFGANITIILKTDKNTKLKIESHNIPHEHRHKHFQANDIKSNNTKKKENTL